MARTGHRDPEHGRIYAVDARRIAVGATRTRRNLASALAIRRIQGGQHRKASVGAFSVARKTFGRRFNPPGRRRTRSSERDFIVSRPARVFVLGRLRTWEVDLLGDDRSRSGRSPCCRSTWCSGCGRGQVPFRNARRPSCETVETGDAVPFGVHEPVAVLVAHHRPRGGRGWRG